MTPGVEPEPAGETATTAALPQVSFVIPARNEEFLLGKTLAAIHSAAREVGVQYEMIVANDDSTDRTAEIAREQGARMVDVKLHNIGQVRNAGAAVARGPVLFFLDADTLLPANTLAAALGALEGGALAGGATVQIEGITWPQRALAAVFTFFWQRIGKWAAGCCIFIRRETFEAIGGFDANYFAAEEKVLSDAVKARGRFVILREKVITSGRKLRIYKTSTLLGIAFRGLVIKRAKLTSRDGLEMLYDAPRESATPSPRR